MISNWLPQIVERSENGPYMRESDFDKALIKRVRALVREYDLKFDRQVVVPTDDDMADRLYQAGTDLFVELGAYNQSTERRILFTREEVEAAVGAAPSNLILGTGKDAVVMRYRPVESKVPKIIHSGPTGTPCSERYHPAILQSCAQEPLVDCLGAGSVSTYHGRPVIPGTPVEVLAAQKDAAVARDVVRKVGRPEMHINDVAVPLTTAGKMSTVHPEWGLRSSDAFLVTQLPELKVDYDQLSRVPYMQSRGLYIVDLMTPLIGGLGGGPEGTAVVTVACHLLGVICFAASYHIMGHMTLQWSHNTGREGLWGYAMAGQALARNTPILTTDAIYTRSGLGTPEVLWEVAAGSIVSTVCGLHTIGVGATGGSKADQTSGIENRFNAEVAHASLGLTRQEANDLALECLKHYEHMAKEPNPGKSFSELYNVETVEPNQEWLDVYHQVRGALIGLGLDMDRGWQEVRRG